MAEQDTGNGNVDAYTKAGDYTPKATQRNDTTETETTRAMGKQEQRNAGKDTSDTAAKESRCIRGNYFHRKQGTSTHRATSEDTSDNARRNGARQRTQKAYGRTYARISNKNKQKGHRGACSGGGNAEILHIPALRKGLHNDNGKNKTHRAQTRMHKSNTSGKLETDSQTATETSETRMNSKSTETKYACRMKQKCQKKD